jgi:hypothetical protein
MKLGGSLSEARQGQSPLVLALVDRYRRSETTGSGRAAPRARVEGDATLAVSAFYLVGPAAY